jgi:5-methylcytosine-specific restriction endonuclease McrA
MGFGKIKIDKQDALFSKLIRERDGRCVFCDKSDGKLECSHFWGRGNKATRFDPLNCDTLCFTCHNENEGNKQGFYRTWKINQLGQEEYDKLEKRARLTANYRAYEKPVILNHLKKFGLDDFKGMAEKCFWHEVKDLL